jgi:hypothetical protein
VKTTTQSRSGRTHGGAMLFMAAVGAAAAGLALVGHGDEPAKTAATATATPPAGEADKSDIARKAEIMNSTRWRRAIFELGEWLSSQQIYTPAQVNQIKVDFNRRVAGMSSFELQYLLDDLDSKLEIIDTPEAREVRAWVGQYLSVMSDQKRAEVLRDVPNVVAMSAGQLQQEIVTLEQRRDAIRQRQAGFERSRDTMVQLAGDARKETAAASRAAMAQARASFSPYRSGGTGQMPFADAQTGATTRGIFGGMGFGFGFGIL